MNREELERAFSVPRFSRFVAAAGGDYSRAFELYKTNLRVSNHLFSAIAVFEVILRNAVDAHYKAAFNEASEDGGWLLSQSSPRGFLAKKGCEKSRASVLESIQKFGDEYSHDKAVSNLGFAFWRNLFNSKEFAAGGSSLLNIFPDRPRGQGLNQTLIFNKLALVVDIRNKIAHHDPVCFIPKPAIVSLELPTQSHQTMRTLLSWLGFDTRELLGEADFGFR